MKNIGVICNSDKDRDLKYTNQAVSAIGALGCRALLDVGEIYGASDFILVLGGDGTMLQAARLAAPADIPLLGVNLGTLGYLTDIEPGEMGQAVASVLQGKFSLEKRMMLETSLSGGRAALNDAVISRGMPSKLIQFELHINSEYIDTIRGDGIIVSTPTGSTAYNLAAGGPILKPDSEMMVITPICPHALYLRPWVVSAGDAVGIRVLNEADAMLNMDGQNISALEPNRLLCIRRSPVRVGIIKTKPLGFYETLRRKMNIFGQRDLTYASQEAPRQDH